MASSIPHGVVMGPDRRLDEYAARQFGAFSLAQARRVGFTDRMVDHRLGSGTWLRLAGGVYALASSPPSWERRLAAAVLSRPESIVAGMSAAHLHEFVGFGPGRPVVMVPLNGNARSPLAKVIRSRYFADISTIRVGAFVATTPAETIVNLSSQIGRQRLESLIDDCLAAKTLDAETLMLTVERRSGLKGIPTVRRLIEERLPDAYQPPTSVLERLLYDILSQPGIPQVVRQFPFPREVVPGTVDAYVPEWRLIIEADGRRWHTRKGDFERDRARDNLATSHGIAVLRFTYQMLNRHPEDCLATILDTGRVRARAS